jgi:hypothetical protein
MTAGTFELSRQLAQKAARRAMPDEDRGHRGRADPVLNLAFAPWHRADSFPVLVLSVSFGGQPKDDSVVFPNGV